LARNDIVTLLEKTEKEWWKGELNGAVGFFPSDYVIEIPRKNVSVTQVEEEEKEKKLRISQKKNF